MKDFHIPKPLVVITILLGAVAVVGAVGVYWVVKNPPVFSNTQQNLPQTHANPLSAPTVAPLAKTPGGFLVLKVRAAVEQDGPAEAPAFEGSIENMGFSETCEGKVVTLNAREQDRGVGSASDGAIAEAETTFCLPADKGAAGEGAITELTAVALDMEPEDKEAYPQAALAGQARAKLFDSGRGVYQIFVGAVAFTSCVGQCEQEAAWGTMAMVSAAKVTHPLDAENYLFAVPLSNNAAVGVGASVQVER